MSVYIEESAWASCTFDLAGSPQQLVKQSDRRVVGYPGQDRLLTIDDRATKEKFQCKLVAKQWGGLLGLCGGIALGFLGPVGWIGLAVTAAVVVVGTAVAVAVHDCSDPLNNGHWEDFNSTVFIQGKNAVLYGKSKLMCGNSGILIASTTQAAAQELSDAMKWNARIEVGVQILSNGLVGYFVGEGVWDPDGLGEGLFGLAGDWDLATVPLAILSYKHTDFDHAIDYGPVQSALAGLVFSSIDYGLGYASKVPWLGWLKNWGTEIEGWTDLKTTVFAFLSGLGGDLIENYLKDRNIDILNRAAASSGAAASKTIICVED